MSVIDPKSQYAEAKRLHAAGQHAEALALLDALDRALPNTKNIMLARAECLVKLGDRVNAAQLCDAVLTQHDDARARRILKACTAPGYLVAPPWPLFNGTLPQSRGGSRRLWITLPLLAVLGIGTIGVAAAVAWRQMNPGETAAAFSEADLADASQQRAEESQRRADARAASGKRDQARQAETEAQEESKRETAREKPGYEIPESEWDLDPATGGPTWRPGIYRQLPCLGSWFEQWQSPRTVDVYIPMAYAENDAQLFPVLAITMPELNPGFRGYETWAEKNSVVIVVINTSCNDCKIPNNREAQLAAYDFLTAAGLRAHPQLTITTGVSGGAQMAWIAAYNSPNTIPGVLMVAHGGYREMILPATTRVAFVNGQSDWNADYIVEMIGRLNANGNEIRHETVPGGHIEGPIALRTRMLDWLLNEALSDLAASEATGDGAAY